MDSFVFKGLVMAPCGLTIFMETQSSTSLNNNSSHEITE